MWRLTRSGQGQESHEAKSDARKEKSKKKKVLFSDGKGKRGGVMRRERYAVEGRTRGGEID